MGFNEIIDVSRDHMYLAANGSASPWSLLQGIKILNTGYCAKYLEENLFDTFPSLTSLTVSSLGVGFQLNLDNISHLNIKNSYLSNVQTAISTYGLIEISFEKKSITSEALSYFITNTTSIEAATFRGCDLNYDHIIQMTMSWINLKRMTLDSISFMDISMIPFANKSIHFEELIVTECSGIQCGDIYSLLSNSKESLKVLKLSRLDLVDSDILYLIETYRRLTTFHITSRNSVILATDDMLKTIGEVSQDMINLSLNCANSISDVGISYLCGGVCNQLQELSLGTCSLTSQESAVNIAKSYSRTLKKLDFKYTGDISVKDTKSIYSVCEQNVMVNGAKIHM